MFVLGKTCFNRDRWVLGLTYVLDDFTFGGNLRRDGCFSTVLGAKAGFPQCWRKADHENRGPHSLAVIAVWRDRRCCLTPTGQMMVRH